MTKTRRDSLYLVLLGSVVFLALGLAFQSVYPTSATDFKALYWPARCLVQHHNPYIDGEVLKIYDAEGGSSPLDSNTVRKIATQLVYPPSAFSVVAPFALLNWERARISWLTLCVGSFLLASFLVWDLGATYAPDLTGFLLFILLINSELIIVTGNSAGLTISLCVISVWCLFRERFVTVGIFCLAISLAVKPQDSGLVWLYFLLAGGVYRKRAMQTLLATAAVSLPGVLWVWNSAPNWIQQWHSNILAFSAYGGINDPGPASTGGHGLDMLISLQTAVSVFRDDPHIYNAVSYIICGALLLTLGLVTVYRGTRRSSIWLALAAISALSMLPVYHRQLDATLLLLTVPGCAILWSKRGLLGWAAFLLNTVGFLVIGFLPWAIFLGLVKNLHLPNTRLANEILMTVEFSSTPLILLIVGIFYLWINVQDISLARAIPDPEVSEHPFMTADTV